jgi:hypothetical protein
MAQTLTLPEKIVDMIGFSNSAMEQADAFQKQAAAETAKAVALVPSTLDLLIQHERIYPEERAKAAEMLKTHAGTIELLTKVAAHRNKDEAGSLGTPVNPNGHTKTAGAQSYDSLNSAVVGGRNTRVKQSDIVLHQRLGLPLPTE